MSNAVSNLLERRARSAWRRRTRDGLKTVHHIRCRARPSRRAVGQSWTPGPDIRGGYDCFAFGLIGARADPGGPIAISIHDTLMTREPPPIEGV